MRKRLVFAIPGDLDQATGGYGYDRRIMRELAAIGWEVEHLALPSGFPVPSTTDLDDSARELAAIADGSLVLVDGLAFGSSPALFAAHGERLRLIALVHHPLCLETGLDAAEADRLFSSERKALRHAQAVVVTSRATARTLAAEFGVRPGTIVVAPPGTDPRPRAPASGEPPRILSVGSLVPRKGHDVLIEALARIADLLWTCRIVGEAGRDNAHAAMLGDLIEARGLTGRVTLAGRQRDIEREFVSADLFALATLHEGYGMVFAEAIAHGLPIVGTRAGAVPDLVPGRAGMLVAPGDAEGLAAALRTPISDPEHRRRLADGAWDAARDLPDWAGSARLIDDVLKKVME